jgi:single-strand DNA-binding protein
MSKTNQVQLIGRIGQEPQLITTEGGKMVSSFSMATKEVFKNEKGEKQEHTDWHNVVVFGKLAQLVVQYLKKGSQLMVQGKLQTRNYQTKEGESKYRTEIIVNDVLFLDNKTDN